MRRAVHILNASAATPLSNRSISRSSVRRARIHSRAITAATVRDSFINEVQQKDTFLVLHWDGKLLQDCTGNRDGLKVDRLPILVSSPDIEFEKLLAIPKLSSSTRAAMANATVRIVCGNWKKETKLFPLT